MAESAIEWTELTWNPSTGCDRVSPGCDNCYALTLAKRLKAMGQQKYQRDGDPRTSGPGFGLTLHPDVVDAPRSWSGSRVVFVNSMSDLFHDDVPLAFIGDVFAAIADTPQHTYQVLTKRSKRLSRVASQLAWPRNLWMGVSVESQRYAFRVNHLREVPAAIRFVSAEPLLGHLRLDLAGIHWLIAGGESGTRARPADPSWIRALRDQCRDAQVAFFFKQWGGRTPKAGGSPSRRPGLGPDARAGGVVELTRRGWGYWTEAKLDILSSYLPAFTTASQRSAKTVYLDLFAGNEVNQRRDTGKDLKGSPVRALATSPELTELYSFELAPVADRLRRRLHDQFPDRRVRTSSRRRYCADGRAAAVGVEGCVRGAPGAAGSVR